MKKLLKNPALLFAIMLVVSSCGNETKSDDKSDDKYEPKSDARFLVESFEVLESMRDNNRRLDGDDWVENYKTIIKGNEEIIEYNKKLIKTVAYYVYQADEDEFDRFIKDIKELPESDRLRGVYLYSKKGMEKVIKELQQVNDSKKEMNKDLEREIKNYD